jgi:pyridoxamine 5'-phosphate oxidase
MTDVIDQPGIAALRREYAHEALDEGAVAVLPLGQFDRWFKEARAADLPEPSAMTLATCDAHGRPSARIVLVKHYDERGFVFFTNYDSHKGQDLAANNRAALLFFWPELERQVRIQGRVEKVSAADSDESYRGRPAASRIAAWASPQSQVVPGRTVLEARVSAFEAEHGKNPPRPTYWGGYRVVPQVLEFWQGRRSRLHDRIQYRLKSGAWVIERLAP